MARSQRAANAASKRAVAKPARDTSPPIAARVADALASLRRLADPRVRDALGPRYGIHTTTAWGVTMAKQQVLAKSIGRDHALALALWDSGTYDAQMLAILVDEPARVTAAQMDRWCGDFDNWATCDTACFKLFDQTPHAWRKITQWSTRRDEFGRRAAFALLATMALHRRSEDDAPYHDGLRLVERAADDDRNFVRKGVNWALRAIGERPSMRAEAVAVAQRLASSTSASARWIGKDALSAFAKRPARRA